MTTQKHPITPAEWRFLETVAALSATMPPTLREVGSTLGIASTGTLRALHAQLALRALMTPPNGSQRNLVITPAGRLYLQGASAWTAETGGDAA